MGVDIVGYSRVKLVPQVDVDAAGEDRWDRETWRSLYNIEDFLERGDTYPDKSFADISDAKQLSVSMSYGGYNRWREWLAQTFLGVAPEVVWDDYETYKDRPFGPLIHFADNEGFFGPEHVKRLAADFAAHQPNVRDCDADFGYQANYYKRIAEIFKLAASTGFGIVRFS